MSAPILRILIFYFNFFAKCIFWIEQSSASPLKDLLDNIAVEPRELDQMIFHLKGVSILRRDNIGILPADKATTCKNTPPKGSQWASEKVR